MGMLASFGAAASEIPYMGRNENAGGDQHDDALARLIDQVVQQQS